MASNRLPGTRNSVRVLEEVFRLWLGGMHSEHKYLKNYDDIRKSETQSKKEAEQMSILVRMPVVDVEVVEIQSSASKFKPPLGVVFLQRKRVSCKLKDKQTGRKNIYIEISVADDILVWIRIRRSMPDPDPVSDPDTDPDPAIFVTDLQEAKKKLIFV
jgi:hypothetical protein